MLFRTRNARPLRFAVVGVANTALTWLMFWLLLRGGSGVAAANIAGWCAGGVSGFLLSRHWTFRGGGGPAYRQVPAFIAVNLLAVGLSTLIVVALAAPLGPWPAEAAATAVTAVATYFCYRSFVFR